MILTNFNCWSWFAKRENGWKISFLNFIPKHSQTLHTPRVKNAESEKKVLNPDLAAPLGILDLAPAAVVEG